MSPRHLPVPFILMLALMLWPSASHATPTMTAAPAAAPAPPPHVAPKPVVPVPVTEHVAASIAPAPVHVAATPATPAVAATDSMKTRNLKLGRLYFKSTSEVGADGVTKTTRSWGLASKADGTGRSFDRSVQKEHGADGETASRTATITLGKADTKGNSVQRTWSKDTATDASGSYKDSSKSTIKTSANDDGSANVSEKHKSDTRLTTTDGAVSREVIKLTRSTDGKSGVVTTTETKKNTGATAPVAAPVLSAHESSGEQLGAVGIAKFTDAKGTVRFRDTATGRFVSAADANDRLQK